MNFYWLLFFFVVFWTSLMALQKPDAPGGIPVLRLGIHFILVVFLSLFAGFFSETGSVDYENYAGLLSEGMPINTWEIIALKDPLFQLIGFFLRSMGDGLSLLILFVTFVSLGIKFAIFKSSYYKDIFSLAVIFLVARFFLLHEFTQIRVSLGIALISFSILYAMANRMVLVSLMVVLAALVHLSTLALLPAVLLACRFSLKTKICFFAFFALVALTLAMAFDGEKFSRIAPYLTGEYEVTENTLFSYYFIFKMAIFASLFMQWKSLRIGLRSALLTSSYGVFLTLIFLKNDVLSLRLGELTAVFDCICFAYFFRYGLKLNYIFGYMSGVVVAALLYFSSMSIVNPLSANF